MTNLGLYSLPQQMDLGPRNWPCQVPPRPIIPEPSIPFPWTTLLPTTPTNPMSLVFTGQLSIQWNLQGLNSPSEFLCSWIPCLTGSAFLFRLHTSGHRQNLDWSVWATEQPVPFPQISQESGRDALGNILPNVSGPLSEQEVWWSECSKHQLPSTPFPGSWQILQSLHSFRHKITSNCVHSESVSENSYLPV